MKNRNKNKNYSGQIGLLLLVILGLLITLVMSVASRSLSDVTLARQEKEQSATFTVAESGVEEALRSIRIGNIPTGVSSIADSLSSITGQYTVLPLQSIQIYMREGEVVHANLVGYTGTISVSWTKRAALGENVSCQSEGSGMAPAALEVALVSSVGVVQRQYYNASNCPLSGNGFATASAGGVDYLSTVNVAVPAGTSYMRLRAVYNGATINVSGISLPSQLYLIQSRAEGGDSKKEIEVKRTIDYPAGVFDFAVFSGTTIVK